MATTHSAHPANSVLVRTAQLFLPALGHLTELRDRRQIRRTHGEMSPTQLRDIGLTPWDVAVALSLPLETSAADTLSTAAANEAGRW